jgi:hypothetical protein
MQLSEKAKFGLVQQLEPGAPKITKDTKGFICSGRFFLVRFVVNSFRRELFREPSS